MPQAQKVPAKRVRMSQPVIDVDSGSDEDIFKESPPMRKIPQPRHGKITQFVSFSQSEPKNVDISQVSTGSHYDVEEIAPFFQQKKRRSNTYSEEDINRVVSQMNDIVEPMPAFRQSQPSLKDANVLNMKKFRKAPQGRHNPTLPLSQVVIGEEDFCDFRSL